MIANDVLLTLRHHAVRLTAIRQSILGALLHSPFALSRTEIEHCLALDRVTVYRTLRTFEEKGIVHRIVDHSETVRYAAACPNAAAPALANDHVHFKCTACQHIYCLSQVPVPTVALPGTYQVLRSDHLLSGICGPCQLAEATNADYLLPVAGPATRSSAG
jgi:Fur family ferric uptake transcriptional regulator